MRIAILLVVALGLAVAACGDSASGGEGGGDSNAVTLPSDPADAALQQLEYVRNDQRARDWSTLHPAHQALVARGAYIECPTGGITITSTEVIEVFEENIPLAGLGDVDTTAVTVEIAGEFLGNEVSDRITMHLIDVDGTWRWILTDEALDAFKAGDCP